MAVFFEHMTEGGCGVHTTLTNSNQLTERAGKQGGREELKGAGGGVGEDTESTASDRHPPVATAAPPLPHLTRTQIPLLSPVMVSTLCSSLQGSPTSTLSVHMPPAQITRPIPRGAPHA
jgi:hypothetical protein